MTASVTSVTCRCGPITSIARPLDLARCHHLAQELTNVCIFEAGYACQIARAKRRDRCVEGSQELGAFVRTMNLGRIAQRAPQACDAIESQGCLNLFDVATTTVERGALRVARQDKHRVRSAG